MLKGCEETVKTHILLLAGISWYSHFGEWFGNTQKNICTSYSTFPTDPKKKVELASACERV